MRGGSSLPETDSDIRIFSGSPLELMTFPKDEVRTTFSSFSVVLPISLEVESGRKGSPGESETTRMASPKTAVMIQNVRMGKRSPSLQYEVEGSIVADFVPQALIH